MIKRTVILAGLLLFFSQILLTKDKIKVGNNSPNFSVKSIYEKEYSIPQKNGKKNILLFFTDKNCDICFDFLNFINEYIKQFNTTEFEIWLISNNGKELKETINEIDENVFIFMDDLNGLINNLFDVTIYPFCILINKANKISAIHIGFNENEEKSEKKYSLVYILNAYLSKKKIKKIEEEKESVSTPTFNIKNK